MILNEWTMIAIGLAVILAVIIPVLWIGRWRERKRLRGQFGPEYEREVAVSGSRARAVDELEARRRRVASYELRALTPADKEELTARWRELQKGFVERPSEAVARATALIDEAMERRGYPLGEIRHKDADLSVHYPREVQAYREAGTVAERSRRGDATTEELREAMVNYRVLFDHLLGNGYEPRREIAS
ncbi:MAG TPA: hypothetical protein VMT85_12200 [Thermoanaerobaculia bacterium]|nr:hypothetical protein [Thermoanaerobaculia bacterium]